MAESQQVPVVIAYAPAWAVWLALGLWGVALVLAGVAFVMARRLWGQVKPMVEPYLMMFGGGSAKMSAAAGTGDVGNVITSSPAAVPDRCEYDDHEWAQPQERPGGLVHHCVRCGYVEAAPGR